MTDTKQLEERRYKIKRDLQLLKGEDDAYVLSNLASMYGLPALVEYIASTITAAETAAERRGRIDELKNVKKMEYDTEADYIVQLSDVDDRIEHLQNQTGGSDERS